MLQSHPAMIDLHELFGDIDIYLFDQLLRGRIPSSARILDAGCGGGRNLVYFLRGGFDVYGVDASAEAVASIRTLAATLAPGLGPERFTVQPIETMSFDAFADVVISSAVLHFARDDSHFDAMLSASWRAVAPGGLFFCRLASSIGMETRMMSIGDGRFRLPDGTIRYLVHEPMLLDRTEQLGGTLLDPLKTTVVQGKRCMTTWVMRKNAQP
jgi:tellurite methyltransferase